MTPKENNVEENDYGFDLPAEFIRAYGKQCHGIVEAVGEMASKGNRADIVQMMRLMERIANAGLYLIEQAEKAKAAREEKEWAPRWAE